MKIFKFIRNMFSKPLKPLNPVSKPRCTYGAYTSLTIWQNSNNVMRIDCVNFNTNRSKYVEKIYKF